MCILNFITADEARVLSHDSTTDNIDYEYLKLLNMRIQRSAQKGKREIIIDDKADLKWYAMDFLKSIGYSVKLDSDICVISW